MDRKPEVAWTLVSEAQTPDESVTSASKRRPLLRRTKCVEAVFTESGLDAVTESQWYVIVAVVVGSAGRVERFKVLHRPPLSSEIEKPIAEALVGWLYEPLADGGGPAAVCDNVVFTKRMGDRASSICD